MSINIESIKGNMQGLKGIYLISLSDNFLIHSWQEEGQLWDAELVGANTGSVIKKIQKILVLLNTIGFPSKTTIETDDFILTIRQLSDDFGLSCIFDRNTPIGMIRIYGERLHKRLLRDLQFQKNQNPGQLLMTSISGSSTNLDADLLRLSIHSGVELERFQSPEKWSDAEFKKIQQSAESILGISI